MIKPRCTRVCDSAHGHEIRQGSSFAVMRHGTRLSSFRTESGASAPGSCFSLAVDTQPSVVIMAKLFSAQMELPPVSPLWPDYDNDDPSSGWPVSLSSGHSRFPIEPSAGYGDLSFDPSVGQNGVVDERENERAWRLAMRLALGNLVSVRISNKRRA
jgi:hypothetical protein